MERKNLPVTGTNEKVSKTVFTLSGTGFALINYSEKIFKSTDFGESWTLNFTLPDAGIELFFMQPDIWFVMSKTKFYKSSNGGINWINSYTAPSNQSINNGYFINENTGWVNFRISTFPPPYNFNYIHKTTNGGINWISEGIRNSSSIYFHNLTDGVYTNKDSLMRTSNGGTNWIYVNLGANKIQALAPKGKDLYLSGEYGMIMREAIYSQLQSKKLTQKFPINSCCHRTIRTH